MSSAPAPAAPPAPKEAAPQAPSSPIQLYSKFALAGALGCSVTHGAACPIDV